VIALLAAAGVVALPASEPRVLVLNSYHPQYRWTERLVDGIRDELADTVGDENLHIEYMDGRRFADDESFAEQLLPLYRLKYSRYSIDVVISTDDIAFQFLIQHGDELFPGVPVVFGGVNDYSPESLAGHDNFTGILEGTEVRGNIDLILQVHPETRQIVALSDRTEIGRNLAREVREILAEPSAPLNDGHVQLVLWDDFTIAELMQRAASASPGTVFLMLAIHQDRQGSYFSYARDLEVLSETSSVPIYGMWGAILLGRGVLGGLMNDPDTHGRDVAALAKRILSGERVEEIPIVPKARYEPAFDYRQMQRFGVQLDQIPVTSSLLGRPPSFYSLNKQVVWVLAAVIAGLLMSTLFLLGHLRQRRLRRRDKRETVRLRENLAHVGRLGVMGEMATGIAHEINQPLTAIGNYAHACRLMLDQGSFDKERFQEILDKLSRSAKRAGEVIRRLRTLVRKRESELEEVQLNDLVADVAALMESDARLRDMPIQVELAEFVPPVTVDEVQIQQVVLNLLRNGMDAMEDVAILKRRLWVRTAARAEAEVELSVTDRGIGIPEGLDEELFHPFVTTRESGMGMGLSICRSIVDAHGGRLWFTRNPEGGATFHVALPTVVEASGERSPA
jgi:signal transduction histidine kinase/ABC-type uncharacterized transport system substrate-binding protein